MAVPTVNVTTHVEDSEGSPIDQARVHFSLNRVDVDEGLGYVVPNSVTGTTNASGDVVMAVWPNALGATESSYEVTIVAPNNRTITSVVATIPNNACNLWDVANLPVYPGKSDGELTVAAAINAYGYAQEWANKAEDSLVTAEAGGDQVDDYSSLHWSLKSEKWASTTGAIVEATDYSAKEYAIGTFVPAGSSKEWATVTGAQVDGDYSAKEHAIGTTVPAGSAKDWAIQAEDSLVDGAGYSALHHAAKSAASAAAAAADLVLTNADVVTTNADVVLTNADVVTVEGIYDQFDDRYLGAKASPPTLDNDGQALLTGAMYWSTVANKMYIWGGAAWSALTESLDNTTAIVAPTANDDSGDGYSVGSLWIDTVLNNAYRCVDATLAAAVWIDTTLEIADLGSMATQDANAVAITGGTASGLTSLGVSGSITVTGNVDGRDLSVDGAKLDLIADNANNYVHPTYLGDDFSIDTLALTGATVISDLDINITTDTQGHVTDANAAVATRALTPANIGAQPAGTYNTIIGTDTDYTYTGATVPSTLVMTDGVVTSHSSRTLTIANLGITATAAEVNYTTDVTSNIQAQLNLKAALASPALTGNPTAPTQTAGNNSTRLATTAFVQAAAGTPSAGSVGQSQLKTTTGSTSTTSSLQFTMAGGMYTFAPQVRTSNAASYATLYGTDTSGFNVSTSSATFVTAMAIARESPGYTAYVQYRYVQASPPYNLGDGDIPLFIFGIVDNTSGKIESTYVAPEAPWHHNGPTDIKATRKDKVSGRAWKTCCAAEHEKVTGGKDAKIMLLHPSTRDEGIALLSDANSYELEITQNIKQADMHLIPHPFGGTNLTGKTVVILDPVSPITEQLFLLHEIGEDIDELLQGENIVIGNSQINRVTPNGTMCVSLAWKTTV